MRHKSVVRFLGQFLKEVAEISFASTNGPGYGTKNGLMLPDNTVIEQLAILFDQTLFSNLRTVDTIRK
jgi:hypothetical protein